ncbi:unnamed protein product, partial [Medioppia subpectinata]
VPAPKRPARNRSPVDIKPSLIDSIPLVPEIVNKAPEAAVITLTSAGNELIRDIAPGIRVVKKRTAPADPRLAAKTARITAPDLIPWHPCPYVDCRQTFNTRLLLSTHVLSDHSEHWRADQRFSCDKCHLKYSTGLALHSHQTMAHPMPTTTEKPSPDLIPCPYIVCRERFLLQPSLIDSIPLVPEIVNKGPEAVITLTSAGNELIRDIAPGIRVVKKRKAPVDPRLAAKTTRITAPDLIPWHPCPYVGCRQTFNTQSLLATHTQSVHSWVQWSADQPFPCDKCHHKYSTELALHSHQAVAHPMPTHTTTTEKASPDLIPCPNIYCRQTFTSQSLLFTHLQYVHSWVQWSADQRYPCDKCYFKYSTEIELHSHQSVAHPMPTPVATSMPIPDPQTNDNNSFKCHLCHNSYNNLFLFMQHMNKEHPVFMEPAAKLGVKPLNPVKTLKGQSNPVRSITCRVCDFAKDMQNIFHLKSGFSDPGLGLSQESDLKCRELCEEMSALKASNESEVKALREQLKTSIDSMQTITEVISTLKISNESEVKALKAQLKSAIDSMHTMETQIKNLRQKLCGLRDGLRALKASKLIIESDVKQLAQQMNAQNIRCPARDSSSSTSSIGSHNQLTTNSDKISDDINIQETLKEIVNQMKTQYQMIYTLLTALVNENDLTLTALEDIRQLIEDSDDSESMTSVDQK